MKTKTLIVSAGLAAVAFAQVASETPTKDAYIFSYFCGQSDGLHLAVSDDGLNWTALNGNKSVLKPMVGKDRLMRDPSICRVAPAANRFSKLSVDKSLVRVSTMRPLT